MIKLNKRDMELYITQGYKVADDLLKDLVSDSSNLTVSINKRKVIQEVKALNKKKHLKDINLDEVNIYIKKLKSIMDKGEINIDFLYESNKIFCSNLQFSSDSNTVSMFSALDIFDLSDANYEYILLDFTDLLDYLAFEIGHETYDEKYTLKYFDSIFGNTEGVLYPLQIDRLKEYVPKNFYKELSNWYIDTSINSAYYVKTSKKIFNYFMQEQYKNIDKKKVRYFSFDKVVKAQNEYLTCVILYYILIRANSSVIQCKLVEIKDGKIILGIGENKFNKEYFKEHLSDDIYINLLDRKFIYTPQVVQL